MFRPLLWKEWREQRWKLAFGCVILAGFVAVGLRARLVPDQTVITLGVFIGALLLPVLTGMGLVAGERAEGTLGTLLALPVRPVVVLIIKTLVGLAATLAPLAAAAAVACLIAGGREVSVADILRAHAVGAAAASVMLLWTLALGARQATEARAAMLALGFLLLGFMPLLFLGWQNEMVLLPPVAGISYLHPIGLLLPPQLTGSARWAALWQLAPLALAVEAVLLWLLAWAQFRPAGGTRP